MKAADSKPVDLRWSDGPALLAFGALLIVVFLQFVTRYVLNSSLGWTEEIARYLLMLVCYAGAVRAMRRGGHVFLEVVYRRAPTVNARPMAIFVELLGVAYHAGLAWLALALALDTKQRMVSIDAPKALVYAIVAACLLGSLVHGVIRLRRRLGQTSGQILQELEEPVAGNEGVEGAEPIAGSEPAPGASTESNRQRQVSTNASAREEAP